MIKSGSLLWYNIDYPKIISFLNGFMAPDNPVASPARIAEFINAKQKDHELDQWHVAVMSSRAKNNDYDLSESMKIWQFDRSEG